MRSTPIIILGALLATAAAGPAIAQTPTAVAPAPPAPGAVTATPRQAQPPAAPPGGRARAFADRFAAANTTGDGRLTLAQARAGHMPMVVKNFTQIDTAGKGYVTMDDIRSYRRVQAQQRKAANPPT
jgi:hypothetical protein